MKWLSQGKKKKWLENEVILFNVGRISRDVLMSGETWVILTNLTDEHIDQYIHIPWTFIVTPCLCT